MRIARNRILVLLSGYLRELSIFTHKQAQASIFGGLLLLFMLLTVYVEIPGLHRYDYIFLYALGIQLILIWGRFETKSEVLVILLFHIIATVMELYKTADAIGSWHYPEAAVFAIGTVPLFAGFMYSAVGSYIARAWKLFQFRFTNYPSLRSTIILSILIYVNFFTHHFVFDVRYILVLATVYLFWRTRIYFTLTSTTERQMPLLVGFGLVSFFIWIAENVSTFAGVWLYPNQVAGWTVVSADKCVAWFLLMIISFVLVSCLYRTQLHHAK